MHVNHAAGRIPEATKHRRSRPWGPAQCTHFLGYCSEPSSRDRGCECLSTSELVSRVQVCARCACPVKGRVGLDGEAVWDAVGMLQSLLTCPIAFRKALTWKYYAKKILYYLRQQKILNNLKAFLQQPDDYESYLEGGSVCTCGQDSSAFKSPQ